ncbi:hypothetical protein PVAP13_9KG408732 [Panicum virgatum]|uniref:Uncharacterized protein n=1 Tax=Panicum virgatum TaxID=38727 RepID=A0A8T0NQ29_PANVG|nr:hypothetical protein PVAP13_9KG408732 [Panicum virgatum]
MLRRRRNPPPNHRLGRQRRRPRKRPQQADPSPSHLPHLLPGRRRAIWRRAGRASRRPPLRPLRLPGVPFRLGLPRVPGHRRAVDGDAGQRRLRLVGGPRVRPVRRLPDGDVEVRVRRHRRGRFPGALLRLPRAGGPRRVRRRRPRGDHRHVQRRPDAPELHGAERRRLDRRGAGPRGAVAVRGDGRRRAAEDPAAAVGATARAKDWKLLLNTLFWNLNGWDSVSTMAGEVDRPGRTFPAALVSAVCIGSLGYLLPLMAATGAVDAPPEAWGDGYFADAAGLIGGEWLKYWMEVGAAVSSVGLYSASLSSASYLLAGMAEVGHLPSLLAARAPRFGTPWASITATGAVALGMSFLSFDSIVAVTNFLYGLGMLLELAAFLWLRARRARRGPRRCARCRRRSWCSSWPSPGGRCARPARGSRPPAWRCTTSCGSAGPGGASSLPARREREREREGSAAAVRVGRKASLVMPEVEDGA